MADATVPDVLRRRAAVDPGAVALSVQGGRGLTFREWDERSNALARGLVAWGVQGGDRVALVFDNARWPDLAVAQVAVHKAGAVAVPLAPRFPELDLVRVLAHCRPSVIVCPSDLASMTMFDRVAHPAELEAGRSKEAVPGGPHPGDAAEILYAPGAMRRADPAIWSHVEVLSGARGWPVVDSPSLARPFVHAFAVGSVAGQEALWLPLRAGQVVIAMAPFDPWRFRDLVVRSLASGCGLRPSMALMLLSSDAADAPALSSLEQVVVDPDSLPAPARSRLVALVPGASMVGVHATWLRAVGLEPSSSSLGGGVGAPAPVAPSQEGMLWNEQFAPGSFNLALVRRYRGRLDVAALEAALGEIVRRHAALRTTFSMVAGPPVQIVAPSQPLELPEVDLSGLPPTERDEEMARFIAAARTRPFDLVGDSLFQPTLLRLAAEDHVLAIRVHHSAFDDWSVGVFRRELSALYAAFRQGESSLLHEPPVQFAEFSRARRQALDGDAGERERAFWRQELAGAPLSVQLPIDDPRRLQGSVQAATEPLSLDLPAELAEAVRAIAHQQRATPFMVVLAAFGVLVQRYTGQDDLVLSSVVANRNRPELEGLIGCFSKKIAVRLNLSGDPPFHELVTRTRRAVLGALLHQDLAYEAVLGETLRPDAARHGLVPQVAVRFQAVISPTEALSLPGLTTSGIDVEASADRRGYFLAPEAEQAARPVQAPPWGAGLYFSSFLGLMMSETDDGVGFRTEGVFDPPAVARLLRHFGTLLADIAVDPSRPLSELSLLDHEDRAEQERWNDTCPNRMAEAVLDHAFEAQVLRTPGRTAVVFGDDALTFGELDARAKELARRLRASGVGPEVPVGVCVHASTEVVVAILAVWKAGGAVVPIDPLAADEPLRFMLRDAGVEVVVGDASAARRLVAHPRVTLVDPRAEAVPAEVSATLRSPADPRHLAYLFYARGAGIEREAVELEHGAVLNLWAGLRWAIYGGPHLRVWTPATPAHPAFLRQVVALCGGHTLHLVARQADEDPRAIVAGLRDGVVDMIDLAPSQLGRLLEAGLEQGLESRAADGRAPLRPVVLLASTEPLDVELWRVCRDLRGAEVHCLYAPAECSFAATTCHVGSAAERPIMGRPLSGVRSHVLDRRGRPVPVGVVGELHLGGTSLARGYLGHPERTEERFVLDPLAGGGDGRLYRTSHLARILPGGDVELLGSMVDHVEFRGFLVQPRRIERVLAKCPGVTEVVVVVLGESGAEQCLVAYVVPESPEAPPSPADLRRFLWTWLPGYAWPAMVVAVDAIPRLPNGSLNQHHLPPPDGQSGNELGGGQSRTFEEALLASTWAEVRGVESVGVEESYWQRFSFLDVLCRARDSGLPVSSRQVTRNRTLESLAVDIRVEGGRQGGRGRA